MSRIQHRRKTILNTLAATGVVLPLILLSACTNIEPGEDMEIHIDSDGDGISDAREITIGTDKNDPCNPVQGTDYTAFDSLNAVWLSADCDSDGISNADELLGSTNPYFDEALIINGDEMYVIPEFLPKLSELQLFEGDLKDLTPIANAHVYDVNTPLFADYAYKLRVLALPQDGQMTYNGEGMFLFPDHTVLTETIYYLDDERDPSLGKTILETRVLIKKAGEWNVGRYVWNAEQSDALLDEGANGVTVNWIDNQGDSRQVNYFIPPQQLCVQCHALNNNTQPIGVKARNLNLEKNGSNQLQDFIDLGLVSGAPDISQIPALPDWSDTNFLLEERARAYMDMNCAHCHQPEGSYNLNYGDTFDFRYETSFEDSHINEVKVAIQDRMNTQIPNYFMPFIGTTVIHDEGVALINAYIESLE